VFYAFMLSGIITVVLGLLQVGKLLRLLPASVMVGFVNGLSIVVFLAQLSQFKDKVQLYSCTSCYTYC
jgi:sulfate permease, SulP family